MAAVVRGAHRGGWITVPNSLTTRRLQILPLLAAVDQPFQSQRTTMVLLYGCLAAPERAGVGSAGVVGLLMDVLKGGLLGKYALGPTLVAFVALKLRRRIRVYPMWQQAAEGPSAARILSDGNTVDKRHHRAPSPHVVVLRAVAHRRHTVAAALRRPAGPAAPRPGPLNHRTPPEPEKAGFR